MNAYDLTDEQRAMRDTAREFARKEIVPVACQMDREFSEEIFWRVVEKGVKLGLTTLFIPRRYGGCGASFTTMGLVSEELGAADAGFATVFGASLLGLGPILILGTEEQKERFLGEVCSDENHRLLCAFAVTEPGSGSDAAADDPRAGVQLTAAKDGGEYILSGTKQFISNGSVARLLTVLARTDKAKGAAEGGLSFFAVRGGSPGLTVGKVEDKMGQRASPTAQLLFDGVRVPQQDLLGGEGRGFEGLLHSVAFSGAGVGALCVGIGRAALEAAVAYARERIQGGRPIVEHQAIATILAEMATRVEAARALTLRALQSCDARIDLEHGVFRGLPDFRLASMAKVFASDMCVRVTTDAVQVFGGYGYMKDFPVEKLMRDAKLTQIYEGTNQIHRIAIARFLS